MFLFEIPTGVVADTLGRRASYLLGTVTLAVTTVLYYLLWVWESPFWAWAIVSVLLGLGFTFFSGAVDAWLVDALARHRATRAASRRVFGRALIVGERRRCSSGRCWAASIAQLTEPRRAVPHPRRRARAHVRRGRLDHARPRVHARARRAARIKATKHGAAGVDEVRARQPAGALAHARDAVHRPGVGFYVFYALQPYLLELWGDPKARTRSPDSRPRSSPGRRHRRRRRSRRACGGCFRKRTSGDPARHRVERRRARRARVHDATSGSRSCCSPSGGSRRRSTTRASGLPQRHDPVEAARHGALVRLAARQRGRRGVPAHPGPLGRPRRLRRLAALERRHPAIATPFLLLSRGQHAADTAVEVSRGAGPVGDESAVAADRAAPDAAPTDLTHDATRSTRLAPTVPLSGDSRSRLACPDTRRLPTVRGSTGGVACARTLLLSGGVAAALVGAIFVGRRRGHDRRSRLLRRPVCPHPRRPRSERVRGGEARGHRSRRTDVTATRPSPSRRTPPRRGTAAAEPRPAPSPPPARAGHPRPDPARRRRGPAPTTRSADDPAADDAGAGRARPVEPARRRRLRLRPSEREAWLAFQQVVRDCMTAAGHEYLYWEWWNPKSPTRPTGSRRCPPTSPPRSSRRGSSPSTATPALGDDYRWEDAGCWGYAVHVTGGTQLTSTGRRCEAIRRRSSIDGAVQVRGIRSPEIDDGCREPFLEAGERAHAERDGGGRRTPPCAMPWARERIHDSLAAFTAV